MNHDRIARYIGEIPGIVPTTARTVAERLARFERLSADRLLLVGSGSSFNALTAASERFADSGAQVSVMTPTVMLRRSPTLGRALILLLSQSGRSAATVAALRRVQSAGLDAIALTAEADSPLACEARRPLLIPVGDEDVGPKTKGYAASLAALLVVADWIVGRGVEPPPREADLSELTTATGASAGALAAGLDDVDFVAVAGEDRHFGTALEASLKISEMSGLPAAGYALEEMMHGRLHGLTSKSVALLIVSDEAQRDQGVRAAEVMRRHGVRIVLVNLTGAPTPHDWLLPVGWPRAPWDALGAILPFQQLAAALAARRGRPPHRMPYPGLAAELGIRLA